MSPSRLIIIGFGLLAILGALAVRGVLFGPGGLQTALGLTVLITGILGVFNTLFFIRLKTWLSVRVDTEASTELDSTRDNHLEN